MNSAGQTDVAELGELYGDDLFYSWQVGPSYESAQVYCGHLAQVYRPASVVDFGCGRGAWLKAMHEAGASRLVGVDGPWNTQQAMIDPAIEFHGTDLNHPDRALSGEQFDLAMSLEVFEHLQPANSEAIADFFTALAPVLMFGGAFTHQGGQNHINERPHSFWARLFLDRGFEVFDYFRPAFWGDERVCYYYQQNTYLYVRKGHPLGESLRQQGHAPVSNLGWLDAVHPVMLYRYAGMTIPRRLRLGFAERAPAPLKWLAGLVRRMLRIAPIRGPEGRGTT
jgi:hypothetical protein